QLPARAYERADRLAGGKSADALIGQAEALVREDETELDRRAGRLLEQALVLEPENPKSLFYAAAGALHRGELPMARERFAKLLALNPPDSIKPLLQKQIEAIDQQIAGVPAQAGALASAGAAPQGGAAAQGGRAPGGQPGR